MRPVSAIFSFLVVVILCAKSSNSSSVKFERVYSSKEGVHKYLGRVNENGYQFTEEVSIDKRTGIETIHVPSHPGIEETHFMFDTRMNISVSQSPRKKHCYISNIPRDQFMTPQLLDNSLDYAAWNSGAADSVVTTNYWSIQREIKDISQYPLEVGLLCKNHRLFQVEKKTLLNTYHHDRLNIFILSAGLVQGARRMRRQSMFTCPHNQIQSACLIKYSKCYYIRICPAGTEGFFSGRVVGSCKKGDHRRGNVLCCKTCCNSDNPKHATPALGIKLCKNTNRADIEATNGCPKQ